MEDFGHGRHYRGMADANANKDRLFDPRNGIADSGAKELAEDSGPAVEPATETTSNGNGNGQSTAPNALGEFDPALTDVDPDQWPKGSILDASEAEQAEWRNWADLL